MPASAMRRTRSARLRPAPRRRIPRTSPRVRARRHRPSAATATAGATGPSWPELPAGARRRCSAAVEPPPAEENSRLRTPSSRPPTRRRQDLIRVRAGAGPPPPSKPNSARRLAASSRFLAGPWVPASTAGIAGAPAPERRPSRLGSLSDGLALARLRVRSGRSRSGRSTCCTAAPAARDGCGRRHHGRGLLRARRSRRPAAASADRRRPLAGGDVDPFVDPRPPARRSSSGSTTPAAAARQAAPGAYAVLAQRRPARRHDARCACSSRGRPRRAPRRSRPTAAGQLRHAAPAAIRRSGRRSCACPRSGSGSPSSS